MADVVDINSLRLKKAEALGENSFLLCPCDTQTPRGFVPVVMHHAGDPLLIKLICLNCDAEVEVEGRILS